MAIQNTLSEFLALLSFFTEEQGGLKTPAVSGDRIKLKFEYETDSPFAEIEFVDDEIVYAGDSVIVKLIITTQDFDCEIVSVGTAFDFKQADKTIGKGIIKEVII